MHVAGDLGRGQFHHVPSVSSGPIMDIPKNLGDF